MRKYLCIVCFFLFCFSLSEAQVFSNKEVGKKNTQLIDSLKKSEYPYVLPIWGKKVTEKAVAICTKILCWIFDFI